MFSVEFCSTDEENPYVLIYASLLSKNLIILLTKTCFFDVVIFFCVLCHNNYIERYCLSIKWVYFSFFTMDWLR